MGSKSARARGGHGGRVSAPFSQSGWAWGFVWRPGVRRAGHFSAQGGAVRFTSLRWCAQGEQGSARVARAEGSPEPRRGGGSLCPRGQQDCEPAGSRSCVGPLAEAFSCLAGAPGIEPKHDSPVAPNLVWHFGTEARGSRPLGLGVPVYERFPSDCGLDTRALVTGRPILRSPPFFSRQFASPPPQRFAVAGKLSRC